MNLKGINDNPLALEWKKRYSSQPFEVKEKLDALSKMPPKEYQLRTILKSKIPPRDGDIFLLSPRENIFFYGKVIKADIDHLEKDPFIHGKSLVFIFNVKTTLLNTEKYKADYKNLLIPPEIVDNSYWKKGLFYTVGTEQITEEERKLDYGFYKIGNGKYYKENGIEITHQPSILGTYGVATISGIASKIEKEIIINPEVLRF